MLAVACKPEQAAAIESAMGDGAILGHCESPIFARDILNDGRFDSAVIGLNDPADVEDVLEFCEEVRNNPRLFNLPIVILRADGIDLDAATAMQQGASRPVAAGQGGDVAALRPGQLGQPPAAALEDPRCRPN